MIVGQFGAAPPAMDGVVLAEVVGLREDFLAKVGERQSAVLVRGRDGPLNYACLDRTGLR
jgi:hypothetical protein